MEIKEKIKNLIKENDVCLFMKGTPDSPQCGFSMAVSNVLKHLEVNFEGINVLEDEQLRQGIKDYSDWPTIPQLYIKEEFVGGCDIVKEMFEKGELKKVFEEKTGKTLECHKEATPFAFAGPDEFKHDASIDILTKHKRYIASKPWAASNYLRDPSKKPNWL